MEKWMLVLVSASAPTIWVIISWYAEIYRAVMITDTTEEIL
jgi:hypothetical protein